MADGRRTTDENPVIVCEVVRRDGARALALRVFCARRVGSVRLETCEACPSRIENLPIRRRTVLPEDGTAQFDRLVSCPRVRGTVDAESCTRCRHLEAASDLGSAHATLQCSPPEAPSNRDPRADFRERATHVWVGDVMGKNVVCTRSDARIEMAAALLVERDLRCLPVVDADRRLIGILTRTDLVREGYIEVREDHVEGECESGPPTSFDPGLHANRLSSRRVGEVMTPIVRALPEDAPLAYGIALMAAERIHEVPVVSLDGRVVGVLTAIDALRWTGEELGYRFCS